MGITRLGGLPGRWGAEPASQSVTRLEGAQEGPKTKAEARNHVANSEF
jgi:hypothetical protein